MEEMDFCEEWISGGLFESDDNSQTDTTELQRDLDYH